MIKEIKNNEVTIYSTIPDYHNKNVVGRTSTVSKAEELKMKISKLILKIEEDINKNKNK